ncbi:MAG: NADH-quinone oxidoreductase subunit M, partial [candidate division KSB1 bacterium]|nr:NADH-quinone oxidoreductase subunit M [candidate division KSB1 bacterium]
MIPNVLSWIIFLPIIGAALVLLVPRPWNKHVDIIRWISAVFTGLQVVLAIYIFIKFDRNTSTMQFVEQVKWIPSYNIWYFVGIDGLSVSMVLLTALLSFLCIFASWGIDRAVKGYFALFLLLDAGMMGVFTALDFFLFYIFWEIMLLPMYFLIGIWGGPRREYAAIKFFLYTLLGSVLMLLAMLVFYFNVTDPVTGGHTFNMLHMMNQTQHSGILNQFNIRLLVFAALYISFAIKIPAFPFHTWLPDAHVEAPTPISVILAGVLLKMGTYGLLRISYPILPDAMKYKPFAYGFVVIAVINIVYGALCAMAQK